MQATYCLNDRAEGARKTRHGAAHPVRPDQGRGERQSRREEEVVTTVPDDVQERLVSYFKHQAAKGTEAIKEAVQEGA